MTRFRTPRPVSRARKPDSSRSSKELNDARSLSMKSKPEEPSLEEVNQDSTDGASDVTVRVHKHVVDTGTSAEHNPSDAGPEDSEAMDSSKSSLENAMPSAALQKPVGSANSSIALRERAIRAASESNATNDQRQHTPLRASTSHNASDASGGFDDVDDSFQTAVEDLELQPSGATAEDETKDKSGDTQLDIPADGTGPDDCDPGRVSPPADKEITEDVVQHVDVVPPTEPELGPKEQDIAETSSSRPLLEVKPAKAEKKAKKQGLLKTGPKQTESLSPYAKQAQLKAAEKKAKQKAKWSSKSGNGSQNESAKAPDHGASNSPSMSTVSNAEEQTITGPTQLSATTSPKPSKTASAKEGIRKLKEVGSRIKGAFSGTTAPLKSPPLITATQPVSLITPGKDEAGLDSVLPPAQSASVSPAVEPQTEVLDAGHVEQSSAKQYNDIQAIMESIEPQDTATPQDPDVDNQDANSNDRSSHTLTPPPGYDLTPPPTDSEEVLEKAPSIKLPQPQPHLIESPKMSGMAKKANQKRKRQQERKKAAKAAQDPAADAGDDATSSSDVSQISSNKVPHIVIIRSGKKRQTSPERALEEVKEDGSSEEQAEAGADGEETAKDADFEAFRTLFRTLHGEAD